ncbi:MAG: ferritin family protein [Desulfobacterales bacterium]|jgi:rubrerythrin
MMYDFNAAEVFNVAVKIEENGAKFYRRAAELQSDPENKKFLEKLAAMEDTHKSTFTKMSTSVTEAEKTQQVFDPEGEAEKYLAAMADSHGGEGSPSAADKLTGSETMEEILKIAIGLEKESILFYLGIKDMVPPKFGQDKVDAIIEEERRHVIQLNGFLKKMASA